MIINITIEGVSKSIQVSEDCIVLNNITAVLLLQVNEDKNVINFQVAVD